jgi:hypothetical protein
VGHQQWLRRPRPRPGRESEWDLSRSGNGSP